MEIVDADAVDQTKVWTVIDGVRDDIQSDSINLHLEYLQPGEYNLQFIWDKNHDNKWSTGKFSEQSQPERFYDYPIQLNVQGGFDIHQEIDLSEIDF